MCIRLAMVILALTIGSLPGAAQGRDTSERSWRELARQIGTSNVIGLGETGHGYAMINDAKALLADFLRTDAGFSVVCLESSFTGSVIAYLDGKTGSERLQAFVYPFWNTPPVRGALDRFTQTESGSGKPALFGFDMQEDCRFGQLANYLLSNDLVKRSAQDLRSADSILALYIGASPTRHGRMDTGVAANLVTLYANVATEIPGTTSAHRSLLLRCLQNRSWLCTYLTMRGTDRMHFRDSLMAENVGWIRSVLHPDAKMLLWAADTHMAKSGTAAPRWMGAYLQKQTGVGYYAISIRKEQRGESLPGTPFTIRYTAGGGAFDAVVGVRFLQKIGAAEWITPCPADTLPASNRR
jgi:erythromycin esterase